jgi:RluA family pseudouridine synthase
MSGSDSCPNSGIGNIPVVFEDQWFLVVNKPSGLLTIPTPRKESRTLTSILNTQLRNKGIGYRLHPCHRLDREASGLIVYAKGKSSQKKMMELFKARRVKKTYVAFARGRLKDEEGVIKSPVENISALTQYKVIGRKNDFTILQVTPLTGRTNQIRIHFKNIGHPLLGETKYAFRRDFKVKAKRLCLHAQGLEFRHPLTDEIVSLAIDLPDDMKGLLLS